MAGARVAPPYLDGVRRTSSPRSSPLAALTAAGCGEDDEQPRAAVARRRALADLTVRVDRRRQRRRGSRARAEVTCAAADDSKVCGAVAELKADSFAPTGTQVGLHAAVRRPGDRDRQRARSAASEVDARFSRENGCEISRWQDVAALLGAAG